MIASMVLLEKKLEKYGLFIELIMLCNHISYSIFENNVGILISSSKILFVFIMVKKYSRANSLYVKMSYFFTHGPLAV
jgi:hypothetical protein